MYTIPFINSFLISSYLLLTPGKSGIHGFGIFAKHPHKAGDMVLNLNCNTLFRLSFLSFFLFLRNLNLLVLLFDRSLNTVENLLDLQLLTEENT